MKRLLPFLRPLIVVALFAISLRVLQHTLAAYRYREVMAYLGTIGTERLVFSVLLTLCGYMVMTGYDTLAFHYIQQPMAYGRIALASFIGYAFNNTMGLSGLVGGSLRYRLYTAWRLSTIDVAKVIAFCAISFWLGFVLLAGGIFLLHPPPLPLSVHIPFASIRLLGVLLLIPPVVYAAWIIGHHRPIQVRGWEFPLPTIPIFIGQAAISLLDWLIAASVLYVLLPDALPLTFVRFLAFFLLAQIVGVASNVPGGLGVFEALMLLLLAPYFPAAAILGSLLAFRTIYYLVPLIVATILLGTHEVLERREGVARVGRLFGRWAPGITPTILAFATFVAGAVLLFSGATPTIHSRTAQLRQIFPLPIVELSHFLGSIAGAGLLLLARGLQRRLDAAYHLTVVVLSAAMVFQLFKGLDFEEAAIVLVMLLTLIASRRHFYRRTKLFSEAFTPGWIAAIALVLICSLWLGFFSYKHVDYSQDLWWRFSFRGDAPRFLRASVGVLGGVLFFAISRLLRPSPPDPDRPGAAVLQRAQEIAASDPSSAASLALLGDKPLLFSDSGRAFIMYGVEGRSWISMGDPVGPSEEKRELIWKFRQLCDLHAGWPVFYEVQRDNLPYYIDLGLAIQKIGEEARVPLDDFSLEGGSRKWLRKVQRRIESEGCSFQIIPQTDVDGHFDEIRAISDAWLAEKRTREKGFSLGFFVDDYIRRFPLCIVKQDGRIVAFSNLWCGGEKKELSVDLMRQTPDAPSGAMDYMFLELMLWGKAEGYRWFNLGMAPLSGLENRSLGPLWNRLGALTYRFGENFYNFQGLRQYKEKFDPHWEPTYLASPGGLVLPIILTNLAALISGGIRGVVSK
jgi:phosphatidylglycerol lysyltransferase